MVGANYWTTGITVRKSGSQWTATLDFQDNGFCDVDATAGTLSLRYFVDDLEVGVDTLIQDAERLGIRFGVESVSPTVYCEQDGELDDGDYPELRAAANTQARRLGWTEAYSRRESAAMREP